MQGFFILPIVSHIHCNYIAFMVVTTQTPASKTHTIVPSRPEPGRHRTHQLFGEHAASNIASSSVCSRQAQICTLYRRRCLCASAGRSQAQDSAVDPPSRLVEDSEPRAVLIVCAIRRLHGEGNMDRIFRTWAQIDAVRIALLFLSSLL